MEQASNEKSFLPNAIEEESISEDFEASEILENLHENNNNNDDIDSQISLKLSRLKPRQKNNINNLYILSETLIETITKNHPQETLEAFTNFLKNFSAAIRDTKKYTEEIYDNIRSHIKIPGKDKQYTPFFRLHFAWFNTIVLFHSRLNPCFNYEGLAKQELDEETLLTQSRLTLEQAKHIFTLMFTKQFDNLIKYCRSIKNSKSMSTQNDTPQKRSSKKNSGKNLKPSRKKHKLALPPSEDTLNCELRNETTNDEETTIDEFSIFASANPPKPVTTTADLPIPFPSPNFQGLTTSTRILSKLGIFMVAQDRKIKQLEQQVQSQQDKLTNLEKIQKKQNTEAMISKQELVQKEMKIQNKLAETEKSFVSQTKEIVMLRRELYELKSSLHSLASQNVIQNQTTNLIVQLPNQGFSPQTTPLQQAQSTNNSKEQLGNKIPGQPPIERSSPFNTQSLKEDIGIDSETVVTQEGPKQ